MHFLGLLLLSLAKVLHLLVNVYTFVVLFAVIISWVNPDPHNPIVRMLYQVTYPIFSRVRKVIPRALWRTGLDFTPVLVLIVLIVFDTVAVGLLFEWAGGLIRARP